jgi:hypothetical protein
MKINFIKKKKIFLQRKIKGMYDVSNISEEMSRYFDNLNEELKNLNEN